MEFALSLDGMAGVCGVWGDMGLPGEEDIDIEVAATIAGTLDSCRLEELDDRWRSAEDDMDSDNMACDWRICWNLDS